MPGGLLPERALGCSCSVSFLQAVDAKGLLWVVVLLVAVSVGAVGSKIVPGLSVSHFSALKASVGAGARRFAGVGAVCGAEGAERGDACFGVVDG